MDNPLVISGGGGEGRKGAARYALPFGAAIVAILFVVVLVYPIMKLSPHDVPAAVLSLDAGADVEGERVDAGAELVDRLTGADGEGGAIGGDVLAWTVFESREELDDAMESGEYYLALVVPEDFSERMAARQGREKLGAALVERLPELADGTASLASGAGQLADGAASLASGLGTLAQGSSTLASGTAQLPTQAGQLAGGASALADGLSGAADGASQVADGIGAAAEGAEGVGALTGAAQAAVAAGADDAAEAYLQAAVEANGPSRKGSARFPQAPATWRRAWNRPLGEPRRSPTARRPSLQSRLR